MYLVLFIVAIVAFGISAVCGGGASFILLPALGAFLPAVQVPAALSIGTSVSSVSRIAAFKVHVRWDIVAWFVPAALPAVWLGAKLLSSIQPLWLEFFIGIFLVINLPFIFKKERQNKTESSKLYLPGIGFVTGFISGLTGAVGLLFNRFYLTYGLSKEEIIATRAANELLLHLIKIALYGSFGLLTPECIGVGAALSAAAVISVFLMKRMLKLISENGFRKIGFIAMVLSGVIMLAGSSHALYYKEQVSLGLVKEDNRIEAKLNTRNRGFAVEISFNEGLELEVVRLPAELSKAERETVKQLANNAKILLIEKVYSWGEQSYELYVKRNGKIEKHKF